jgi:hypothetical protein
MRASYHRQAPVLGVWGLSPMQRVFAGQAGLPDGSHVTAQ